MDKIFKSDSNLLCYTGIPSKGLFDSLYALLSEKTKELKYWKGQAKSQALNNDEGTGMKPGPKSKLTGKEEFTLTMVQRKTGMLTTTIADLFRISQCLVSQIFITWINLFYQVFKPLIKWPSKSTIQKHMPASFKTKYPKTQAIIDCTEFFLFKSQGTQKHSQQHTVVTKATTQLKFWWLSLPVGHSLLCLTHGEAMHLTDF